MRWRLTTSSGKTGLLIGTMHMVPESPKTFNPSGPVVLEADIWNLQMDMLPEVPLDLPVRTRSRLVQAGWDQTTHPMFWISGRIQQTLGWETGMDRTAYLSAKRADKPVYSLESLESQISLMASLPMEQVDAFLEDHLGDRKWVDMVTEMYRRYEAEDIDGLMGVVAAIPQVFHPTMISERNQVMAMGAAFHLEMGDEPMIFVGALHCGGDDSVQSYLKRLGVTAERI